MTYGHGVSGKSWKNFFSSACYYNKIIIVVAKLRIIIRVNYLVMFLSVSDKSLC